MRLAVRDLAAPLLTLQLADECPSLGPRFYRIQTVKGRQAAGELDGDLRAAG